MDSLQARIIVLTVITGLVQTTADDYYNHHPSSIPKFKKVPNNITVHEGEIAKLRCLVDNLGPKMVVWRKSTDVSPMTFGEVIFTPDTSIDLLHEQISEEESSWDLIINNVQPSHEGTYECQISARNVYKYSITLNVLDPLEYSPELTINGSQYVSLLGNIHLTCNATGAEKAFDSVDWFFNGEPMGQMKPKWYGRWQVLNRKPYPGRSLISEIIIEKATMEDRGNYVCRATAKLADGLKVHVLNDTKNHHNPKRGLKKGNDNNNVGKSGSSLEQRTGNSGTALYPHNYVNLVLAVCTVLCLSR